MRDGMDRAASSRRSIPMNRHFLSRILMTVTLGVLLFAGSGCLSDSATGPGHDDTGDQAPALPAAERLSFDFSFFQEPPDGPERASYQNFFNAYVRAVVAGAVTELLLTPPVAAFSLALHTPPTPQQDGSWLWIYTYSNGIDEVQIRLLGRYLGNDRVAWELRVTNLAENIDNELWFEGETWADGNAGFWVFTDFELEGKPEVARLDWGADSEGEFLRFTDLNDNIGDSLEYREKATKRAFTWTDASDGTQSWYVRWDAVTRAGSLRAPDHNGGEVSCWDENLRDTICPDAA
jgi:hypothetical protein